LVRIEKSIEIKASPKKVWEMLALDRLPEWDKGYEENLKSVEYTSEVRTPKDKYKVGSTAHGIPKKQGEYDFKITESLENEKITYDMKGGGFKGLTVTSILESVDVGTKFTFVLDVELPWGFFGKSLGKLMKGIGEKDAEKSLGKLKSILEK